MRMRQALWLSMLLPLGACYVPPAGPPEYAQPGYPPPGAGYGYPPPGYPPPGAYDPYGNVYPGYSENGGDPTLLVAGSAVPLILFGGSWGYWDSRHEWHRAPDAVSRHLEERRGSGGDFRPDRAAYGRPEGGRPAGGPAAFAPPANGGQTFFHPNEQPRPAAPGGAQPGGGFFHTIEQPHPAAQPRPAPPPREEHQRRDCPPGQHC